MKRICVILCIFVVGAQNFAPLQIDAPCFAQDEDKGKPRISPGMEIIKVGDGQNLVLPIGTKTRRVGAQLILEDNAAYVAGKFMEMESRIHELEDENASLKKELEELKNSK